MHNDRRLPRLGGLAAIAALLVAVAVPLTALGRVELVTICHGAGTDGTDHFVTLEVPAAALSAHFDDNGTPLAGHQDDYLGECVGETTDTTESPDTTAAEEESSPTTESPETATTDDVESTDETTPTTIGPETTTTTVDPDTVAAISEGDEDGEDPETHQTDEPALVESNADADTASATLPFTGVPSDLVFPASVMLLAGISAVFITSGFRQVVAAHLAVDQDRFGLGLHRGRHESVGS